MLRVLLLLLASLLTLAGLSGCAEQQSQDPNRVSSIPWNRPQKWESAGPMGSMMQGSQ